MKTIEKYFSIFSSIITGSFYVWDIPQKRFCYIKSNDLFLCGHSVEEAMKQGCDFYSQIIHPEDQSLWINILESVQRYLKDLEEDRDKIDYFSCTFRLLRKYPFMPCPLPQMIYLRMKPVWVDAEPHYLVCTLESSALKEAGNLRLHRTGYIYKEYKLTTQRWHSITPQALTERETAILMLADQGKNSREIAKTLCKGQNTIQNQIKALFAKLEVHSMQEAMEVVKHYYKPQQATDSLEFSEETKPNPKKRTSLTSKQIQYIQELLNKSKSIRQIAKMAGVTESAIRYWINKGLLHKK